MKRHYFILLSLIFINYSQLTAAEKSAELYTHLETPCRKQEEVLKKIGQLKITYPFFNQKKKKKELTKRIQTNLISFIQTLEPEVHDPLAIHKLIDFLQMLTQDKTLRLYLPNTNNDKTLFKRLYESICANHMIINVMTCPDYSGAVEQENGHDTWVFDFKTVGDTEGYIARRSHHYVTNFYKIASKFIDHVELHHYLPSFEFYPHGFSLHDGSIMPYETCVEQLKKSLACIKQNYNNSDVNAQVHLTNELISEDAFQEQKEIYYQKIIHNHITHPQWEPFLEELFKKRNALYRSFHPQKLDSGETDADYDERLQMILKKQIAEYFVDGNMLTQHPHAFQLVSDSPIMSELYNFHEQPVLCGKDATIIEYAE